MAVCRKPFSKGVLSHGCGQCMPCRIKRRREITHRGLLESFKHEVATFATLTYRMECYAGLSKDSGSLYREHTQKWAKRFRERAPAPVRLFGCGEYGEATQRPHYHVIIYGYPTCFYGRSRYSATTKNCCRSCDLVRDTWGLGHIYLGDVTADSIQYVAGYVTKKMTRKASPHQEKFLKERNPEFPIYPNKPGLGAFAVEDLGLFMTSNNGAEYLSRHGDVPHILKHGKKSFPLGRYMRRKLREYYGFPERRISATSSDTTTTPEGWSEAACKEVFELLEAHDGDHKKVFESKMQKVLDIEARQKIFRKRGTV